MAFTWSYSRLKNFNTCPKRHYEVDIAKSFAESTEQLDWGNKVHKMLADACTGKAPLPMEVAADYQPWVDAVRGGPGKLLVEQKYAITKDFQPCEYFGPRVWLRVIADVVRIDGPVGLTVDWKTGKILHDSVQLMLVAQALFAHFPELQVIRTEFIWLKEGCTTSEVFKRNTIQREWTALLPQVQAMDDAARTMTYAPRPGKLCRSYCPVLSCPYHGKGLR